MISSDLISKIARAAGSYKQACIDLMDAGLCASKAMRAAYAHYGKFDK